MKSTRIYPVFIVILNLFFAQLLPGQQKEISSINAIRISESIKIDGDLDEDVWEDAPYATDFIQRELNNGQPATEKTRVAILYDANNLYIGVWA